MEDCMDSQCKLCHRVTCRSGDNCHYNKTGKCEFKHQEGEKNNKTTKKEENIKSNKQIILLTEQLNNALKQIQELEYSKTVGTVEKVSTIITPAPVTTEKLAPPTEVPDMATQAIAMPVINEKTLQKEIYQKIIETNDLSYSKSGKIMTYICNLCYKI